MKKFLLFPLFALLLMFTACNEAANEFENKLVGTWESAGFNEYMELEYVVDYIFNPNGSYEYRHYMREEGERQPVGFIMIERGNYSYNGHTLTKTATFMAYRPYEQPYVSEDSLRPYDETSYPALNNAQQIELVLQNENREFLIPGGIVGGDVIVEDQVFVRVD
ncbi:hypothetical protein KIH41_17870 [Litoribacter ruber]|uniref:hypothetical protein n=1 Tax=Litoribacter ruber TaxID=702568 RepID=UPI001BD9B138|nr:hypothetical protein [Litoribacter ruber]MBT0813161.1 hypothetical protein [Litoribacter ruber]